MTENQPPTPRYRLELTIEGNTLEEVERELEGLANGGFLFDSDYGRRDEWHMVSGRATRIMHHDNPDMTPERYAAELDAWSAERKATRQQAKENR